ncbi:PEP/pyruvate-binding domain-containing protein [Desulfatiferula olefinivorans]
MTVRSRALEVNLGEYHVEVDVDPRFDVLGQVMAVYEGLREEFRSFLEELSHPYKNNAFIIKKARRFALEYFFLFRDHPMGPEGVRRYIEIFIGVLCRSDAGPVRTDAADNLLVYLQKIIRESGRAFPRFLPVLDEAFSAMLALDDPVFDDIVKSYYSLTRIVELFLAANPQPVEGFGSVNGLLSRYLTSTFSYFRSIRDPQAWFHEHTFEPSDSPEALDIFNSVSRGFIDGLIRDHHDALTRHSPDSRELTAALAALPGFPDMVRNYRNVPRKLYEAGRETHASHRWKLLFLFHIMGINGLGQIHEDVLRDINRTMKMIIATENRADVLALIDQAFPILKKWVGRYPDAALNCVLSMGEGIYRTDDLDFVNYFIDRVIDLGFQPPSPETSKGDQVTRINRNHLLNIRIWMHIIDLNPKWSSRLISALIIHLSLCGTVIRDTDLFPRDISRFLSGPIEPVYHVAKQLARLFPCYFNEIGAEGLLRDVSTDIDEICGRRDVLVHYLRKQSHVESSNRLPALLVTLLDFWFRKDVSLLKPWLPDHLYASVVPEGPYVDGVHDVMVDLCRLAGTETEGLTHLTLGQIESLMKKVREGSAVDRKRVLLAFHFYHLLCRKYRPDMSDLDAFIETLSSRGFPGMDDLQDALAETEVKSRLYRLLNVLENLKRLILSDQTFDAREDIYHKRHITVDIPSMYGTYHENRFNAMGLTFRLEALVNVLFEDYIDELDLSLVTKATFFQIYNRLMLFDNALKIDGIHSWEFEKQLNLMIIALGSSGFTYTQYLDIIKGFVQAVRNIVNVFFNNVHAHNLDRILPQLDPRRILARFMGDAVQLDDDRRRHLIPEMFFREKISQALGLQQLDRFLGRILSTLYNQAELLPEHCLRLLLNYDPQRAMADMGKMETQALGIVALGNKGINLCRLTGFGWPVPPGFIITTEVYRCRSIISSYPDADRNFNRRLSVHIREIETRTGKRYGDPRNPLLLSVRSGSSVSQPGMMDSLLNVGINPVIAEALARDTQNPWFAWDNYRRFLQGYGMAFDLSRDAFDRIIQAFKEETGVHLKRALSGDQMRDLAMRYRAFIEDSGIPLIDEPFEQLKVCILKVLESWNLPKARVYRKILGISDDWGTAVNIQSMVFGNLAGGSGSGVIFTHNPRKPGDTLGLWGDFTIGNQGEDVAAGLVNTLPITLAQKQMEQRDTDMVLETHFPEIFKALRHYAADLIRNRGWNPQEIEFTFESDKASDLYILQTRDMVFDSGGKRPVFDVEDQRFQNSYVAHGIGVSGGAMSGRIVFSLDEIERYRSESPETCLILIRNDTVPDDIKEIHAADGLLTARGGITSHASVVAHRLEKTCVVGCGDLVCDEQNKVARLGDLTFESGEFISIDGQEGSIYQGFFYVLT